MTISIYLSHLNILLYLIYLFIWFLHLEENLMMWPLAFLDLVWFIIKLDVYGVGRQFTSKYILWATTKAAVEAVKPAAIIFFTDSMANRVFEVISRNVAHVVK